MNVEITRIGAEECAVCSSLDIAETFEKAHRGVLRDIRNLDCSEKFGKHNFVLTSYTDKQGKEKPMALMTRDGFTFLVMGYTGEKAAQFKEAYIEQFNRMERALYRRQIERETLQPLLRYLPSEPPAESRLLDYWRGFERWREENDPSDKAIVLYVQLLSFFNRRHWKQWIDMDTTRLMLLANTTSTSTAYRARDALINAGLLECQPGKKSKASSYRLLVYGVAAPMIADATQTINDIV